jgi:bifunctional N-acetylglucosamine-1-phosphate-uridyltransferase/glucosamine-1-phosphate-acetyltransferase GlmU-like protein
MLKRENDAGVRVLDLCGKSRDTTIAQNASKVGPFPIFRDLTSIISRSQFGAFCNAHGVIATQFVNLLPQ